MVTRPLWLALTACLLHILSNTATTTATETDEKKVEEALKLLEHLAETRKGLSALKKIVGDIDVDLQRTQKRTCAIGGGMSGHCAAAFLDNGLNMQDWLQSANSPGKRALENVSPDKQQRLQSTFNDLARKRKGLEILERILNEMEADLMYEQKRTCNFNLGGHCSTESAAYVADHWHYLNSPLSPGRKRRDTRLYKKLINGKLLQ